MYPHLTAALALVLAIAAPAPPGPTMAKEDTMHTQVPEVLVRAPRVTLDEILDRVARGEARRDSLLEDETFTVTARVVAGVDGKRVPALWSETVARIYKKRPDKTRSVVLRHWEAKPDKKGANVEVDARSDMSEQIVNFAFRPEARRDFKYTIVGRDLIGQHLVYRIRFDPKSALDPTNPSGLVWIDTNDFVIVRQEIEFGRSPVPIILKGVSRMVIERQRVEGMWVLHRVLLRAVTTIPIPKIGRAFDISVLFDQYAINTGLDDAFFKPGRK